MPVIYAFDRMGGFMVADTPTRRTACAFAASSRANAARKSPAEIAREMADAENFLGAWRDVDKCALYDAVRIGRILHLNLEWV